ncbi:MAG: CDP-alcohol phosphatidyltransferase family protein [Polyangiales bacterium]
MPLEDRPQKTLFILPDLFTLASIFCGYYSIVICADAPMDEDLYRAALLIIFAMFFDTIDGRVARLTKTQTTIGVQLDSLADVVSFGVAPALLVYQWSLREGLIKSVSSSASPTLHAVSSALRASTY